MPESAEPTPSSSTMGTILAFGTYNVRKHPRVGILIDGLRKNGWNVIEDNSPLELSTAQRVDILKKPWKIFGFGWEILKLWRTISKRAKAFIRENGAPDAVLVGYMGHFDMLLAKHVFKHIPIVLDHLIFAGDTAKDRGASGLKIKLLRLLDSMALSRASLVVVDTEEHGEMLRSKDRGIVIPVGAPQDWYQAGVRNSSPRDGIIFYGLYTPLQGTTVIAEALKILAERGITPHVNLVGTGQDFNQVQRIVKNLRNVELIRWIEPEQLPHFVAQHKISLGIFSTTPKGLRVIPNKVYQSIAAGCAVITSDTAPQKRLLKDSVVLVEPGSAYSLANALERLTTDDNLYELYAHKSLEIAQHLTAAEITVPLSRAISELIKS